MYSTADDEITLTRAAKLLTYLGITVTFQLVGFVMNVVYSSYLGKSPSFISSYLFRSNDASSVAAGFRSPGTWGSHIFGDYVWIYSEIKQFGFGAYFGGSQLTMLVLSNFPYYFSYTILVTFSLVIFFLSTSLLLPDETKLERWALTIGAVWITYPMLLALDRGQIHLLFISILFFGLALFFSTPANGRLAAILIGIAISFKLSPIFFLLVLAKRRNWKELRVALITTILALLLPLVYLKSGVGTFKRVLGLVPADKQDAMSLLYSDTSYFQSQVAYNHSFKSLSLFLARLNTFGSNFCEFVYANYFFFAAVLGFLISILVVRKAVSEFESMILIAIASSLLIPIAGGYTLLAFLMPLVIIMTDNNFIFSKWNVFYCFYIGFMMMPKQIPIGFGYFSDSSFTYNSVLNPLCSLLVILITFTRSIFWTSSARYTEVTEYLAEQK